MLIDPAFQEILGQSLDAPECSTVVGPDDITTTYVIPTPASLRPVAGAQSKLIGRLGWTGPLTAGRRLGRLTLEVERFPATFEAVVRLEADGEQTQVTYEADLHVNIPFLGRKLEQQVGDLTQKILDTGQTAGEQWLERFGPQAGSAVAAEPGSQPGPARL